MQDDLRLNVSSDIDLKKTKRTQGRFWKQLIDISLLLVDFLQQTN